MASAEVSAAAAMNRLSVDDVDETRAVGAGPWCLTNWGCSLPLAYDLASEFFRDKFADSSNHNESAVVARLAALNLQVCRGSCPTTPAALPARDDRRQNVADDVTAIWLALGDMPKEAAMVEFIGSLSAVAEPALKSHVSARLSGGDLGQQHGCTESTTADACPSQGAPATQQATQGHIVADDAENVPPGHELCSDLPEAAALETSVPSDPQQDGAIEEGALWTLKEIKEFKEAVKREAKQHGQASSVLKVGSGETLTVRVPTHRNGNSLLWEFATDSYDIAFGIYFEWNDSPPDDVQVVLSDSSDEDEDTELDAAAAAAGGTGTTDPEKGGGNDKAGYGPPVDEIIPIFRRNCHEEVHCGSHVFPGSGIYLLKFDNSYSLWRSKTLYYRVYCA